METTQMHAAANVAPIVPAAPATLRSYQDLPGPRAVALFGNALQIDMPQAHLPGTLSGLARNEDGDGDFAA
jgi:hypothetical protein